MNNSQLNQFDINTFKETFNKIISIGICDLLYLNNDYKKIVDKFVNVISVDDTKTANSFHFILSEDFIKNTSKLHLRKLFSGLANYSTNFVNLHQYRKQTVITNRKIARTYIADLLNDDIDQKLKIHYINICMWLDKITENYAIKIFDK